MSFDSRSGRPRFKGGAEKAVGGVTMVGFVPLPPEPELRQVEREDEELPERLRDFIWIFFYLFIWTVRGREKRNGTGRMESAKRVRRTKHTNGTEKGSENR